MKYAIYYKKRPVQTPGLRADLQEVYAFEIVGYNSLKELEQKGYSSPDEEGFESEAKARAAAEVMIGHAL